MSMIGPTAAHVALSVPIFAVGWVAASFGWAWGGASGVTLYWLGRELAQSFRPSAPGRLAWSWTNTRNFAVPSLAAFMAAAAITLTHP